MVVCIKSHVSNFRLEPEFVNTDKLGDPISSKINDLSPDPNIHDHTGFICVDGTLAVRCLDSHLKKGVRPAIFGTEFRIH